MFRLQQMAPAKQAKIIQDFQKQSAQMDMTVRFMLSLRSRLHIEQTSRLIIGSVFRVFGA